MPRRKVNYYTYTPGAAGAGTVRFQNVAPGVTSLDDILMITNVTRNVVIYNFSDPNRGGTMVFDPNSVEAPFETAQNGQVTLTLNYDTSSHSATDVLQIYVETIETRTRPYDFGLDAVERQRVGIPRSMIDADFEYGLQTTKWSGFSTWRQVPTVYELAGTDFLPNIFGYATMLSGGATQSATGGGNINLGVAFPPAVNSIVTLNVLNQGNSYLINGNAGAVAGGTNLYNNRQAGQYLIDTSGSWFINDYYLLVRNAQGFYTGTAAQYSPHAGVDPATGANAVHITNDYPITAANGGAYQRTFTVTSTADYRAGDIIQVVGLPTIDGISSTVNLNVYRTLTGAQTVSTANINLASIVANAAWAAIDANGIMAVEVGSLGSGTYELMAFTTISTTTAVVNRYINGTNPGKLSTFNGSRVYRIASNAHVETMRIDSVESATELSVTRGWFGVNANATMPSGSVVSLVNFRGDWESNTEILKYAAPVNTTGLYIHQAGENFSGQTVNKEHFANVRFQRQFSNAAGVGGTIGTALGSSPLRTAPYGTTLIKLTGMFVAGNTSMPMVVINANTHAIPQFGGNNVGLGTGLNGATNVAAFVSTVGVTGALNNSNVEGIFINQISDTNYIGFYPKFADPRPVGTPLLSSDTAIRFRRAAPFQGANLLLAGNSYVISSDQATPSLITVETGQPHGLVPGLPIQVVMFASNNKMSLGNHDTHGSGLFVIANVATPERFTFIAKPGAPVRNSPSGTYPNNVTLRANIFPFPTSIVKHRPVDGGTNIGINAPTNGWEATRQTRKYFRYQSGKGMMFTTGTQFQPVFTIANIQANGTTFTGDVGITIRTVNEHALQRGAGIYLYNVGTSGYTGGYLVNDIITPFIFRVMATTTLGNATPQFLGNSSTDIKSQPRVAVTNWKGAKVRSGMFDDANGVFWEYDGQYLWAVKRSATYELAGTVAVSANDNKVVGDENVRFMDTLREGDDIQIRGMVHTVTRVSSQRVIYISPVFRGIQNAFGVGVSIVREKRVRSAKFNLDKLDGTGPSGYAINLIKMQMVAIQYTWYGAGFIDWGMRANDGRMIWAHREKNNNVNDEGYMRSGNLPARYQAANKGAIDMLAVDLAADAGVDYVGNIRVYNIDEFPTANVSYPTTVKINSELINYTAKYPDPSGPAGNLELAQGTSRGVSNTVFLLGKSHVIGGANTAVAHSTGSSVLVFGVTASPDLNHWGSAVILDGDFDVDRTYSFTIAVTNVTIATPGQPWTLFMIRLAPSIGAGLPGALGVKDVLNRAQLLLQNCYVNLAAAQARCLLQAIANPTNIAAANWVNVNSLATNFAPSFSQFVANTGGVNSPASQITWAPTSTGVQGATVIPSGSTTNQIAWASGGEQLFSIPVTQTNSGFIDLSKVKEIGGAIVPGDTVYPNGPEIVAFNIVPVSATFNSAIDLQLTWIESQA
jgi:hypothetical protein